MSYSFRYSISCLVLLLLPFLVSGQVSVTATAGTASASYPTLKLAFDAINFGIHQGQVSILINGNTVETGSAILNSSSGITNYQKVTIMPTVVATISGNFSGAVIDLNGADSVLIDGRINSAGTSRSLTIQNTYTGSGGLSYALQMRNGVCASKLTYLNLEGLTQNSGSNATLLITGTTANKYNIIDHNEFRSVGTGLQRNAILESTVVLSGVVDSFCLISDNLIHDVLESGISINRNNFGLGIYSNSVYQPTPISASLSLIKIGQGSQQANIMFNFLGGTQPQTGGGMAVYTSQEVIAIQCANVSGTVYIDSNIISRFNVNGNFKGIWVNGITGGIATANSNLIGSMADTGVIAITGALYGIYCSGVSSLGFPISVSANNNKIGGLTSSQSLYGIWSSIGSVEGNVVGGTIANSLKVINNGSSLTGISCKVCLADTVSNLYYYGSNPTSNKLTGISTVFGGIVNSNRVNDLHASTFSLANVTGIAVDNFVTANGNLIYNIYSQSSNAMTTVAGIKNSGRGTVNNNIIHHIYSAADNIHDSSYAVQGILDYSSVASGATNYEKYITQNTIHDIVGTSSVSTNVAGIYSSRGNDSSILYLQRNKIYDLYSDNCSSGYITGMLVNGYTVSGFGVGKLLLQNNMIHLSGGVANVFGIDNIVPAGQLDCYFNTIYVDGIASGNALSAAFCRNTLVYTPVTLSDNLFLNTRTGGSGNHFAVMNGNFLASVNWNYSNHNNFYTGNPTNLFLWGTVPMNFATYKSVSLEDSCSVNQPVDFVAPALHDFHLMNTINNLNLIGESIVNITTDIDQDVRNPLPSMGADELLLPFQGIPLNANGATTFCASGSVLLNATIPTATYQWFHNGILLQGAIQDTFTATQAGNYYAAYIYGCYRGFTDTITIIINTVNSNYITQIGDVLQAVPLADTYQWVNCDSNYTIIPGETNISLHLTKNGHYAVIIAINGCVDTSDCFDVNTLSIEQTNHFVSVTVSPNPFIEKLMITGISNDDKLTLSDMTGRLLLNVTVTDKNCLLSTANISKGYYLLTILDKDGIMKRAIPVVKQ